MIKARQLIPTQDLADSDLYMCLLMHKPNIDLQTFIKKKKKKKKKKMFYRTSFVLQVHRISIFAIAVVFAFENKRWFEIIFAYNVRYCTSVTFKTLVTSKF